MSSFADIIDDDTSTPSTAIKLENVDIVRNYGDSSSISSKKMQPTTYVHETVSFDEVVDCAKFEKSRKKVSFSEKDQFYETLYQTPFVNEEDEMMEDTIHVDIESMISGDDLSTSHVSFVTLDKATAGSAFDTESFEDFPLRLSQVESEGPDRFSMDQVIQKLMNLQMSLQPKSGGATPREDTVRDAVYTDNPIPSFGSNIEDDDDVLVDMRQMSDENEMMLELVRAASQSLIECFKPNRKPPDEEAEKKLRAESLQMLLDDDDSEDYAAIGSAAASTTTADRCIDIPDKSAEKLFEAPMFMMAPNESNWTIMEPDDGKSKSVIKPVVASSSSVVIENIIQHQNEGVKYSANGTTVPSHDSLIIPIDHEENISDSYSSSPPLSPFEPSSHGTHSATSSSSSRNGLILRGLVPSRLPGNNTYSSFSVNASSEHSALALASTLHSHSPRQYSQDGRDAVKEKEGSSPLTLGDDRSSPKTVESVGDDMDSKGIIGIYRKSKRSVGTKLQFRNMQEDNSFTERMGYESKQNIIIDESALLWLPNGDSDTPNKSNSSSRRIKVNVGQDDDSCKESSSATTNPCDSRRPSLNNQVEAATTDVSAEASSLRLKPSRLIIPSPESVVVQPATGAHHRRLERLSRQESIIVDLGKGTEGYRNWKLYGNIILLWLLLPVFFCILAYGIIPYEKTAASSDMANHNETDSGGSTSPLSGMQRDLLGIDRSTRSPSSWGASITPWIFVMTSASAAAVEMYSSVISEIEFNSNVLEGTPCDHLKVIAAAVVSTIAMQFLIFSTLGAGRPRNWLAMVGTGSCAVAVMLYNMFYRNKEAAAISSESVAVFRRFLRGLFVLFCVSAIWYTVFTIIYAQYAMSENGFFGYFLAASFPFIRSALTFIMEKCPCMRWGNSKDGLCAGSIVMIVIAMWHGVFLSLIAACVSSHYELILLCLVEFMLQFSVMYNISKHPSSTSTSAPSSKTAGHKSEDKSSPTCPAERSRTEHETSNTKYKARKVIAVQSSGDIENPRAIAMGRLNSMAISKSSSPSPRVAITDIVDAPSGDVTSSEKSPKSFALTSPPLNYNNNNDCNSDCSCHEDTGRGATRPTSMKSPGSPRTPGDDAEEARLATWLGFTWLTGALTPMAFLLCAMFLSIGPNRGLFSPKVQEWRAVGGPVYGKLSAIEVAAGLSRVWSLSIFDRDSSDLPSHMWSIPTAKSDSAVTSSQSSHLVVRLICVSIAHTVFLVAGSVWFWRNGDAENGKLFSKSLTGRISQLTHALDAPSNNCRASKDLPALISSVLFYQFNVLFLSILTTMVVVFSVLFPWYGMNSAF